MTTQRYEAQVRERQEDGTTGFRTLRYFASQRAADQHLARYCEKHNLWLRSQVVRGFQSGDTVAELNATLSPAVQ